MPFIFLPAILILLFFFPPMAIMPIIAMLLIMVCLCILICYFSISNYLSAKHGSPAFEGDFKAFNEADIEKQINANYLRILTLPITKKQSLISASLMFIMFIMSSIFIN